MKRVDSGLISIGLGLSSAAIGYQYTLSVVSVLLLALLLASMQVAAYRYFQKYQKGKNGSNKT